MLLGFRGLHHLLAVLVGAGQEEHVLAVEPLKARQRIGRDRLIGVADMRHAVRIGDRGRDVVGVAARWRRCGRAANSSRLRVTCPAVLRRWLWQRCACVLRRCIGLFDVALLADFFAGFLGSLFDAVFLAAFLRSRLSWLSLSLPVFLGCLSSQPSLRRAWSSSRAFSPRPSWRAFWREPACGAFFALRFLEVFFLGCRHHKFLYDSNRIVED